jgi:2-oxoglutarate dehydrogenase E2 component (dihydrolipoamide succinyltransferase)
MDVKIPQLAEAVTEGDIARWLKKNGERVEKDEPLVELETDKATVEIAAEKGGVLEILVEEGATVRVGDLIARIVEEGARVEEAERAEPPEEPVAAAEKPASEGKPPPEKEEPAPEKEEPAPEKEEPAPEEEKPRAEEAAEKRAPPPREVAPAPEPSKPAAEPATPTAEPGTRRVKMTRLRRRIAERLVEAQRTAAILTTFNEIDMREVIALRKENQERFEREHGVKLGFMSFFARASVLGLRDIPEINAFVEGDEIVYHDYVHLGIAVGTPRGLVVPVLRNADRMSFAEIEKEIKRLATKAREGEIAIEDLEGGTFTISNGGVYGSLASTPILNPPQSGILGMHKIEKRAVVIEDSETGEETIASRPMMYVALSYDHRIVDGEQAVTFLVRIKERLEDPTRLLLDS